MGACLGWVGIRLTCRDLGRLVGRFLVIVDVWWLFGVEVAFVVVFCGFVC